MVTTTNIITDEELMKLPDNGYKYEFVNGELKMRPAGLQHEAVGVRISSILLAYVKSHHLGEVYGSSAGYRLPGGNLRSPDVSFVRIERLPDGKSPAGFAHFAPDLAVEISSPSDVPKEVDEKIIEYFDCGVKLVWLVNINQQTVTVYRSPTHIQVFEANDELNGEDVIPGFTCRVNELFD